MSGVVSADIVERLQERTERIRNICVLAHIDHGKTTLSDFLVSSNGIISGRLAGKVRYLDSRDDEQERGITMKSSSIALLYKHQPPLPTPADSTAQSTGADTGKVERKTERKGAPKKRKRARGDRMSTPPVLRARSDAGVYLVNLIDSPGHIDFCSEVSTAVRFSDGALVLVDVVEGICTQTRTVLETAWRENLSCCLVLNKVDKLITELKYEPFEAYQHMADLIKQVNEITASFQAADAMQKAASLGGNSAHAVDIESAHNVVFAPESGNVAFASAHDTWAFTLQSFADIYAEKFNKKPKTLMRALWGHHYYLKKKNAITKKASAKRYGETMCVQCILRPIWNLYRSLLEEKSKDKMQSFVKKLGIKVPARDLTLKTWRQRLRAILGRYMPIAQNILGMVADVLPSPVEAQNNKLDSIWGQLSLNTASGAPSKQSSDTVAESPAEAVRAASGSCDKDSPHILVYIAKMLDVGKDAIRDALGRQGSGSSSIVRRAYVRGRASAPQVLDNPSCEDSAGPLATTPATTETTGAKIAAEMPERKAGSAASRFLAFARIFSGTLHSAGVSGGEAGQGGGKGKESQAVDTKMAEDAYVLKPGFDPTARADVRAKYMTRVSLRKLNLFLLMGKQILPMRRVCAGGIVGISGLDSHVLNDGTLTTVPSIPPLCAMQHPAAPLVKVALTPRRYQDMAGLLRGLKLLKKADPNVEIGVERNGEHVISASGELHLQRCLLDLKTRFTDNLIFQVSPPIVRFRETILESLRSAGASEQPRAAKKVAIEAKDAGAALGESSAETLWAAQKERKRKARQARRDRAELTINAGPDGGGSVSLCIRAIPLPLKAQQVLHSIREEASGALAAEDKAAGMAKARDILLRALSAQHSDDLEKKVKKQQAVRSHPVWSRLLASKTRNKAVVRAEATRLIAAFGPGAHASNVLLNLTGDSWAMPGQDEKQNTGADSETAPAPVFVVRAVTHAFQMAMAKGPLCEEPLTGVAILVDKLTVTAPPGGGQLPIGSLGPQILTGTRQAIREAVSLRESRLVEAMYLVELQCSDAVLRRLYAVIGKRRGRIISEDVREGTQVFLVRCYLPVEQSFGFTNALRGSTSGMAMPQLVFSHWETIPEDPHFVPTTREEKEEFGAQAGGKNLARELVDAVRKRKGLHVEEHIVEHAEKQRTLARKK